MSQNESKMISEREAVLREREAVRLAVEELNRRFKFLRVGETAWEGSVRFAEDLFPLPKVTRPRVVADPHGATGHRPHQIVLWKALRVEDNQHHIVWSLDGGETFDGALQSPRGIALCVTPERAALFVDLLANPTEEVDADA